MLANEALVNRWLDLNVLWLENIAELSKEYEEAVKIHDQVSLCQVQSFKNNEPGRFYHSMCFYAFFLHGY